MSHVVTHLGNGLHRVDIFLVGARDTTFEVFDLPLVVGRIRRHQSHLVAGTGTAIRSVLTNKPGVLVGVAVQLEADPITPGTIDDRIDVAPDTLAVLADASMTRVLGRLWFYPQPNSASPDHDITATVDIESDPL